jgi:hypothetical protein
MAGNHELFAADDDFEDLTKHAPLKLYERISAT